MIINKMWWGKNQWGAELCSSSTLWLVYACTRVHWILFSICSASLSLSLIHKHTASSLKFPFTSTERLSPKESAISFFPQTSYITCVRVCNVTYSLQPLIQSGSKWKKPTGFWEQERQSLTLKWAILYKARERGCKGFPVYACVRPPPLLHWI